MCGIAGAFAFQPNFEPINPEAVLRLNDLQRRRGPDGAGLWSSDDNRIVLGHRRLAIIDTGTSGAQPMSDATGRWTISFNGEIYNYRALRLELEQLGCVFRTNSDTEVLINAVAQWGEAGLSKLRGMYAFALWDSLDQELWLVRDPYGIKPLYVVGVPRRYLVCVAGALASDLCAGGYYARCGSAYGLLSLGTCARAVFLVVGYPHVSRRATCSASGRMSLSVHRKLFRSFKMPMWPDRRSPWLLENCARCCSNLYGTTWCRTCQSVYFFQLA